MAARPAGLLVVGACCGAVVARRWRPLVKRAVVAGIVGRSKLKTAAARVAENLTDVTDEAITELRVNAAMPSPAPMDGHASTGATPASSLP
jgi:hypothetical protein